MTDASQARARLVETDMNEQPEVLARLVGTRHHIAAALRPLRERRPAGILLVARGSSDNAATYGRYLLEAAIGRPAALSANSLFTRYGCRTRLDGWMAVAISQSGATPEVTEVLQLARELGATTLALTNDPSSPLADTADFAIDLGASAERAVPATKSYTATLVALALVAESIGEVPWDFEDLPAIGDLVADTLASPSAVAPAVDLFLGSTQSVHLGRGFLYCAALESALKMRETAQLAVQGYSTADFLHGPIAASGRGTVALCHVGRGPTLEDANEVARRLSQRGSTVIAIASSELGPDWQACVPIAPVDESLAAVVHAVRGQQLAVEVALARGLDPDRPQGLTKVTPTA